MSNWLPIIVLGAVAALPWCYAISLLVSNAYFREKLAYQRQLLRSLARGEKVNG